MGHWRFRNEKMDTVMGMLSMEERIEFDADVRNIDWPKYLHSYCWGTLQYAAKQDLVDQSHGLTQILRKNT